MDVPLVTMNVGKRRWLYRGNLNKAISDTLAVPWFWRDIIETPQISIAFQELAWQAFHAVVARTSSILVMTFIPAVHADAC